MKQLIEYRIETSSDLKKVYDMWKKFFQSDPWWHFTLEGTYIEIRLSKRNKGLEKYLSAKKWNFTSFSYIDAIPSTRKYQEEFQYIFHGYSEIIMKTMDKYKGKNKMEENIKERRNSIERCIHLCFNLFGFDCWEEAKWLSAYTINRAQYDGYLRGIDKKEKENKKEKKK